MQKDATTTDKGLHNTGNCKTETRVVPFVICGWLMTFKFDIRHGKILPQLLFDLGKFDLGSTTVTTLNCFVAYAPCVLFFSGEGGS